MLEIVVVVHGIDYILKPVAATGAEVAA